MTRKVYKSAMGKSVDIGALLLQNEQVRAVGNMGVNAAGDLIDGTNKVIDQRNRQVQRQYKRQTNVSSGPVTTSNIAVKKNKETEPAVQENPEAPPVIITPESVESVESVNDEIVSSAAGGGLAAAIARSREIKQELEKTMRQRAQESGVRKI